MTITKRPLVGNRNSYNVTLSMFELRCIKEGTVTSMEIEMEHYSIVLDIEQWMIDESIVRTKNKRLYCIFPYSTDSSLVG